MSAYPFPVTVAPAVSKSVPLAVHVGCVSTPLPTLTSHGTSVVSLGSVIVSVGKVVYPLPGFTT